MKFNWPKDATDSQKLRGLTAYFDRQDYRLGAEYEAKLIRKGLIDEDAPVVQEWLSDLARRLEALEED